MQYATPADWATATGHPVPADPVELASLTQRLARASRKVALLTRAAVYRADAAGLPTDAGVASALRDATLAALAYGDATDPDGFGLGQEAITVGPVSLSATGGSSSAAGGAGPEAVEILRAAGLLTMRVGAF